MKKLITILLCILIISGCNKKPEEPVVEPVIDGAYYVDQLRNLKVRDKNRNNTVRNADFDELLEGVFEEILTSNFLDFHFNVADYKTLGVEKPNPDLGEYVYGLDEEEIAYYEELLDEVRGYDYQSLSYDQQYDYDTLEFECLKKLAGLYFYRYKFLLKDGESVTEEKMSYFTDFSFYDEESINDYLSCLGCFAQMCDEVLAYCEQQAADGYPLLDDWIDEAQKSFDSYINNPENNDLIISFNKKIDKYEGLDEKAKEDYKAKNKDLVVNSVVPAYKKLRDGIEQYRGKANYEDYRLTELDKDYADYVYMIQGSNFYTVDEMFTILADAFSLLEAEYISVLYDDTSIQKMWDAYEGKYEIFSMSHPETLDYLVKHLTEYFPPLDDVQYTVEELDPETAPPSVVAYYWQAPVDDDNQNIIRVNPNSDPECVYSPYGTLAHEGFPGHLYQIVYYHKVNPSKFRLITFNLAYLEGWAEYASYYSYRMAGLEDDYVASVLFYDTNSYFFEYSLADIMVNYYGYTTQELYDWFCENSIFGEDASYEYYEALREIVIEVSGEYIPYGIGTSMMFELRDDVANKLGDKFDIIEFNKAVLESGIMPFNILKQEVYEKLNIQ